MSEGVAPAAVLSAPGEAYHFRSAPVIGASQGAPFSVLGEMEREEGGGGEGFWQAERFGIWST